MVEKFKLIVGKPRFTIFVSSRERTLGKIVRVLLQRQGFDSIIRLGEGEIVVSIFDLFTIVKYDSCHHRGNR